MTDDALDREVRVAINEAIRRDGRIPTIADVAAALRRPADAVAAAFQRLADAHVFIARPGSSEIYAYDPFCVGPTDFPVRAAGREWWAICGWDALGVPASLGVPATIEARCADCAEPIRIEATPDGRATSDTPVVLNVGVPARDFWKDIYFT